MGATGTGFTLNLFAIALAFWGHIYLVELDLGRSCTGEIRCFYDLKTPVYEKLPAVCIDRWLFGRTKPVDRSNNEIAEKRTGGRGS